MRKFLALGAVLAAATAMPEIAAALEIKTAPADHVLSVEAHVGRGYHDVMVQTIVIHNDADAPVTLTAMQLDLSGAAGEHLSKTVPVDAMVAKTGEFAGMAKQGLGVFLAAQLLNEDGIEGVLGAGATLASGAALQPREALVSTSHYFAADFAPTELQITVSYLAADGRPATASLRLPVKRHQSTLQYRAPLEGPWMISGFPNLNSHHRFIPSNEFALDFFARGPGGALDAGKKRDPSDDYGFGAPVMAAADGEVVFVIDGQTQDPNALSKRDDETIEEARRRITQYQFQRFAADFRAAAAGNLVVLRHEADGGVEYTSYGHLKERSIAVKVGDTVNRGDVIGAVGNTGDSTLTHLHFQVNAGPDPFFSRSLPVTFENGEPRYVGQEPGYYLTFDQ